MRKALSTIGPLAALFLICSAPAARGEESPSDLAQRIAELERRVATLERLLLRQPAASGLTVAEAESRLAAAEEQLHLTERLHAKGFVTKLQLEADRFAVARARDELQRVTSAHKDQQAGLEMEVLRAEHNFTAARARSQHSERLWRKGFAAPSQVDADRFAAQKARHELDVATAKLKAHQASP